MSTIAQPRPLTITLVRGDLPRLRRFLLPAFFFALPLSKVLVIGGKPVNFSLADLLFPLLLLLMIPLTVNGSLRLPLFTLCLLNCGLVTLSTVLNLEEGFVLRGSTSNIVEVIKWFTLWGYFYGAINLIQDEHDFRRAIFSWLLASGLVAALGVFGSLYFQISGVLNQFSNHYRAQGTFEDSNLFAAYLSVSLMLAILYRHIAGYRASWVWLLVGLQLCGIFLSASRGAMLSFLLSAGFLWLFFTSLRVKVAVVSLAGLLILLLLASPAQKEILASNPITARLATATVNVNNPEAEERKGLWLAALENWKKHPFFGVGRGNHGPKLPGGLLGIPAAHNTYLGLLAEMGVFGFLGLAAVLAAVVYPLAVQLRFHYRFPIALLFAALLVFGLNGMTINLENCRALWVLLAMMLYFSRHPENIMSLRRHA